MWRSRWLKLALLVVPVVMLYMLLIQQISWRPRKLQGHNGCVRSLVFSQDGKLLVSAGDDKSILVWNAQRDRVVRQLNGHGANVMGLALAPDGRTLASTGYDGTTRLWNLQSGTMLRTFNNGLMSVAFSADETRLAVGGGRDRIDGRLTIYRLKGTVAPQVLVGHVNTVWPISFSPDGNYVVTGSMDTTAKIWDLRANKLLRTLKGHTAGVNATIFSKDGSLLLTGSPDRTIKIWKWKTGALQKTLQCGAGVNALSFSPDGKLLAIGGYDSAVHLWDTTTWKWKETPTRHSSKGVVCCFLPQWRVSGERQP
jgi:WD40 repeat protein